jgi:hypothetical protein
MRIHSQINCFILALQFKGDITELEELRELKEDVTRQQQAQATLIQSQARPVADNQ